MTEWLSYSLSDLMMFSKETYFRLFELHNRAVWPAHIVAVAAMAAVAALSARGGAGAGRMLAVIFAGFWAACAWSFHLERYAAINLAAPLFAAAFLLQALLLAWAAVHGPRVAEGTAHAAAPLAGWGILGTAAVVYPLLAPLSGRPWLQAEVAGLAPDPTAAATFALVLLDPARFSLALLIVPAAWAAVSAATLWTLGARIEAIVLPTIAVLTLAAAASRRRSGSR